MIIGPSFVWLHLPKTGGTATAHTFRSLNLPNLTIDKDATDSKHDSLEMRMKSKGIDIFDKKVFITSRRLPQWLLSDWHHKNIIMGLDLPFEPVKSGLFYSLRLGGTWVAADYWLNYFQVSQCHGAIRLEELEADANRIVHSLLPSGTPRLTFSYMNDIEYSSHLGDFFNSSDVRRIYSNNPYWLNWEHQVYGDQIRLPYSERLRGLRKYLAL
jgi:hypothetical protein